jgi:hypothetical protein
MKEIYYICAIGFVIGGIALPYLEHDFGSAVLAVLFGIEAAILYNKARE